MHRFPVFQIAVLFSLLIGCREATDESLTAGATNAISIKNADWINFYRIPDAQGQPGTETNVTAILSDLQSDEWTIRLRAADAVPWRAGSDFREALVPLIDALRSEHHQLQIAAASGIHGIATAASRRGERLANLDLALELLTDIAEGPHSTEIRRWALSAAAENLQGDAITQTIPALTKLLRDPDDQIFRRSVAGLGDFGPAANSAIPEIIVQLNRGEYRALMAASALQQIRSRPDLCVSALVRALKRPDAPQERIAKALTEFGPKLGGSPQTLRSHLSARQRNRPPVA